MRPVKYADISYSKSDFLYNNLCLMVYLEVGMCGNSFYFCSVFGKKLEFCSG